MIKMRNFQVFEKHTKNSKTFGVNIPIGSNRFLSTNPSIQWKGLVLMSNEPNRVRVGERVTIYPRGAKKIRCADFWQDGQPRNCR
jgi:hypothetical protein